jgi:hypothetical protein
MTKHCFNEESSEWNQVFQALIPQSRADGFESPEHVNSSRERSHHSTLPLDYLFKTGHAALHLLLSSR